MSIPLRDKRHTKGEENRMPYEVKRIREKEGRDPTVDDVNIFSLDDMIMYIINFLEQIKGEAAFTEPYEYKLDIARECAYQLGEWFWTIFTAHNLQGGSRCTRMVAPY